MRSMFHLARGETVALSHWVDRSRAHSVGHNIGYWRAVSGHLSGWLRGRNGRLEAGTRQLEENLDAYTRSGSTLSLPHFHILLADLRLAAGQQAEALEVLRAGERHIEATGERFSESDLHRFIGRAPMSGGSPDHDGATAAYERSLSAARDQGAELLELRAATQLALHQRRIGATCAALELVASLSSRFPSGSELPDVVRARAVLVAEPGN